jgi:hypothetical protein
MGLSDTMQRFCVAHQNAIVIPAEALTEHGLDPALSRLLLDAGRLTFDRLRCLEQGFSFTQRRARALWFPHTIVCCRGSSTWNRSQPRRRSAGGSTRRASPPCWPGGRLSPQATSIADRDAGQRSSGDKAMRACRMPGLYCCTNWCGRRARVVLQHEGAKQRNELMVGTTERRAGGDDRSAAIP